jgi:hypothetical protein
VVLWLVAVQAWWARTGVGWGGVPEDAEEAEDGGEVEVCDEVVVMGVELEGAELEGAGWVVVTGIYGPAVVCEGGAGTTGAGAMGAEPEDAELEDAELEDAELEGAEEGTWVWGLAWGLGGGLGPAGFWGRAACCHPPGI